MIEAGSVTDTSSLTDAGSVTATGLVSQVDSVQGHRDGVGDHLLHVVKCLII